MNSLRDLISPRLSGDKPAMKPNRASSGDLSGAADDAEEFVTMRRQSAEFQENQREAMRAMLTESAPKAIPAPKNVTANVWRDVFNPGRNYGQSSGASARFDSVPNRPASPQDSRSVWDHVVRSETHRSWFAAVDANDDGFIDKDELRVHLGSSSKAEAMMQAADKNGDGRISMKEFESVLKALP